VGTLAEGLVLSRRRAVAGLVAAAAVAPDAARAQPRAPAPGEGLTILYVGAKDCQPCQVFKNQELPHWMRSPYARLVPLIQIEAPRITGAFSPRYWPPNYRFVLHQVTLPIVPQFFLLDGATILIAAGGVSGWRTQILPQIPGVVSGGAARSAP
jgi:hypothetical protein